MEIQLFFKNKKMRGLVKIRPFRYGNLRYFRYLELRQVVKIRPFRYGNLSSTLTQIYFHSLLKSDRFGMEMQLGHTIKTGITMMLKSDRFGMEILASHTLIAYLQGYS